MSKPVPSRALPRPAKPVLEVYVRPNAIQIAVEVGMTDLAVWCYRACEAMPALRSADIEKTWDTVVAALRERRP